MVRRRVGRGPKDMRRSKLTDTLGSRHLAELLLIIILCAAVSPVCCDEGVDVRLYSLRGVSNDTEQQARGGPLARRTWLVQLDKNGGSGEAVLQALRDRGVAIADSEVHAASGLVSITAGSDADGAALAAALGGGGGGSGGGGLKGVATAQQMVPARVMRAPRDERGAGGGALPQLVGVDQYNNADDWTGLAAVRDNLRRVDGRKIKLGVLDAGVDYSHPALGKCSRGTVGKRSCRINPAYNFFTGTANGVSWCADHGTHVAGIAAGRARSWTRKGLPWRGVAHKASIGSYTMISCDGWDPPYEIAGLQRAAADGMDVINLSWGWNSGLFWPGGVVGVRDNLGRRQRDARRRRRGQRGRVSGPLFYHRARVRGGRARGRVSGQHRRPRRRDHVLRARARRRGHADGADDRQQQGARAPARARRARRHPQLRREHAVQGPQARRRARPGDAPVPRGRLRRGKLLVHAARRRVGAAGGHHHPRHVLRRPSDRALWPRDPAAGIHLGLRHLGVRAARGGGRREEAQAAVHRRAGDDAAARRKAAVELHEPWARLQPRDEARHCGAGRGAVERGHPRRLPLHQRHLHGIPLHRGRAGAADSAQGQDVGR
ncbi:MAG: hypothetical protein J3K34DRAFT_95240 [Monoraphidium minutum]|nr:MAG: hypothetical protein J3K34DRAFT_95240 [Monoraphidium minutum]